MDVLVFLTREAGEVVTRERLLAEVWDGLHVTEDALNRAISRLRKVFEDDPAAPRFIGTIRQWGYRLVVPVRLGEVQRHPAVPRRRGCPLSVLAAGVLVAAVGVAVRYMLGSSGTATVARRTEAFVSFVTGSSVPPQALLSEVFRKTTA